MTRAELAEHVARGDESFLFFDAALWDDDPRVFALPALEGAATHDSRLVSDSTALIKHAPALYTLLNGSFVPSARDLRAILEHVATGRSVEEAACERAPAAVGFELWRETARRPTKREVHAFVCDTESHVDYDALGNFAQDHLVNETNLYRLRAAFYVIVNYVDCDDPSALAVKIVEWRYSSFSWRVVGVAAPAELASRAADSADYVRVPLVAYTPAPAAERVGRATGDAERLATALRALLAACGWTRLGVVSEDTPLARAVTHALAADGSLATYTASANDSDALGKLRECNTRVFFVNCDAAAAKRVLEAAAARGAAPAGRELWLVRDYEAPDAATAALAPLSLSFQWRGERAAAHSPLQRRLAAAWPGRAVPRHAASLLDALITIGEGFERLITERNETLDYPDTREKLRSVPRSSRSLGSRVPSRSPSFSRGYFFR